MILQIDTREQLPLEFPKVAGVEVRTATLSVGDYAAIHTVNEREVPDLSVCERKSVADLFHSFTSEYDAERAKILKAQDLGLTYILAIEAPLLEVLKGHVYWKDGELHEVRKTGMAMIRQTMTLQRKYGIQVHFFQSRKEMAFWILEFFLAQEHVTYDRRM